MASEMNILREIGLITGSTSELKLVFDRIMRILSTEIGIESGRLVVPDETASGLRIEAGYGLSQEALSRGTYSISEGIIGNVFATGEPRVIADVRKEPDYLNRTVRRKSADKPYSLICLPITSEGETIGVWCLDKPLVNDEVLQKDFALLSIIAAMISQAVRLNNMLPREKEEVVTELAELHKIPQGRYQFTNIVGSSPAMMEVFRTIGQVAGTRATVLLMGETGTGKEMIAKAIHYNSDRKDKPFVRVNCGALSGQLLESELFGHVQGAFTGAVRDKIGRFQAAHGGTMFLDEIATLDVQLQVKLLRVLQEREFERVGDHQTITTDVRIIAASNTDLTEEVKANRFRDDLYYRLNVVAIRLPPLRERREDIASLIDHFLDKYNKENNKNLTKISREMTNFLTRYPWPGNVRELENVVERAVVLSQDELFTEDLLPLTIKLFIGHGSASESSGSPEELMQQLVSQVMSEEGDQNGGTIWNRIVSVMERTMLQEALKRCEGVKIKAADYLGINRNTLNKKYNEMNLDNSEEQDVAG